MNFDSVLDFKCYILDYFLVNGGLSQWSEFGVCSKSCGGGVRIRRRYCSNPVPRFGGKECDPSDMFQTQSCSIRKCNVRILKGKYVSNVVYFLSSQSTQGSRPGLWVGENNCTLRKEK